MKNHAKQEILYTKKVLSSISGEPLISDDSPRLYRTKRMYHASSESLSPQTDDALRREDYVYMLVYGYGDERIRKVIPKSEIDKVVPDYLRREYLLAKGRLLESNLSALERFHKTYRDFSFDNILDLMPERYHDYDKRLFFDRTEVTDSWETEPYDASTFKLEERKHLTTRGLKVRSKSEVAIAELLYILKLPFHYEEILYINGVSYIPDFKIKAPNGDFWYLEHCGLTGNPDYMERHYRKLANYAKAGIVPWKNLIVTYEDENGSLDLALIRKEIETKILGHR